MAKSISRQRKPVAKARAGAKHRKATRPATAKPAAAKPAASKQPKWVYAFGAGKADGRARMRDLLGGKGANLAEMANLGLPVPPGFTITTEVCTYFYAHDRTYPKRRIRCWCRCVRAPAPRCPA
jgi:pyruvate, orthophosphate dikinase